MLTLDRPAQGWARSDRSGGSDELSNTIKRFGQPEVYVTVAGGLIATGLISGDDDITRAGGRVATSVMLAGLGSQAFKYTFGRTRPHSGDGDEFAPFSSNPSLPSGHTAVAFALAASLSDEIHHPMATIGLYGAATGVAWSRVYQDHHWASDVILGAGLGIVSAKFANGKLTVFGVRAPTILIGPQSASVSLAF